MRRTITLPVYWPPEGRPDAQCDAYTYFTQYLGTWLQVDTICYYDEDREPDWCTSEVIVKVVAVPKPEGLGKPHHYCGYEFDYNVASLPLGENIRDCALRVAVEKGILIGYCSEAIKAVEIHL
jgi:hypothetical protein